MATVTADLQQIYMVYLNRPADPAGLAYWQQAVANGASLASIAAGFAASGEYQTAHQGQTNQQLVQSFYQNLFGRAGDADGVAYWVKALGNGATLADIGTTILHGAQNSDAAAIAAKTTAANDFTAMLAKQDDATANALLAKAAFWLAGVTDAASQIKASAGLADYAASALQPSVLDVTSKSNFNYAKGTVEVKLAFSDVVYVDTSKGTPTIRMETGANDAVATYVSGSGSKELVFSFAIKGGDTTSDLDYVSSTALALNGATIKNAAHYDASLALPTPGEAHSLSANQSISIDTTAPVMVGFSPTADASGAATDTRIEVHFSEPVTVGTAGYAQFTIKGGGQTIVIDDRDSYTKEFTLSADGKTITLDPQVALLPNTSYTVTFEGYVADKSGNYLGNVYNPDIYAHTSSYKETVLHFSTGDANTPTVTVDGSNLHISGSSSGNQLAIDLNQHTISEGTLPAGAFTNVDISQFGSAIKLQALDGAHNTLTGTDYGDILIGGNALNGVAAVNDIRGGGSADTLVAGSGSDNHFHYAMSEYYGNSANYTTFGMETLNNWAAAHSNTISFDGLTLTAGSGAGTGIYNGNFPTTMHLDADGLAVFDSFPAVYDQFMNNSAVWYMSWYAAQVMDKAPPGATAVFNYKDDSYLVVMNKDQANGSADWQMIKVTGVHSDGLVFDADGHIATGTFIANT